MSWKRGDMVLDFSVKFPDKLGPSVRESLVQILPPWAFASTGGQTLNTQILWLGPSDFLDIIAPESISGKYTKVKLRETQ